MENTVFRNNVPAIRIHICLMGIWIQEVTLTQIRTLIRNTVYIYTTVKCSVHPPPPSPKTSPLINVSSKNVSYLKRPLLRPCLIAKLYVLFELQPFYFYLKKIFFRIVQTLKTQTVECAYILHVGIYNMHIYNIYDINIYNINIYNIYNMHIYNMHIYDMHILYSTVNVYSILLVGSSSPLYSK